MNKKKITSIILTSILLFIMAFSFFSSERNIAINHSSLLTSNEDNAYIPQYLDFIDNDRGNILQDDKNINTMAMLQDGNVFFGGAKGEYGVEKIGGGSHENIGKGNVGGLATNSGISSVFLSPNDKEIVLGFDDGFLAYMDNPDSGSGSAKYPPGWDQTASKHAFQSEVMFIEWDPSESYKTSFFVIDSLGQSYSACISNNTLENEHNVELNPGETITSTSETQNSLIMLGTSIGRVLLYNPANGETKVIIGENVLENSNAITTISYISSSNVFLGQSGGWWASISQDDKKPLVQGQFSQTTTRMTSSLIIPDVNGTEVLVGGTGGEWLLIDTNTKIENIDDHLINSGTLLGGKTINALLNLDKDTNNSFLFGGDASNWFEIKPYGFVTGFDENKPPVQTLVTGDEYDFKVTTKNDYPDWPIDIKSYMVKTTVTNHTTGSPQSFVSCCDEDGKPYVSAQEIIVKIKDLSPSETYDDITLQLTEDDGTTLIGNEWHTGVNFKTDLGRVKNISAASYETDSVTSSGFKFKIDTFDCTATDEKIVSPYNIVVLAKVDGASDLTTIWTSLEQNSAVNGTEFTVGGLSPGVEYKDVSIQAWYEDETPQLVGTPFKLASTIKTKNSPKSISSATISEKTSTSLTVSANINAEDSERTTDSYYMQITTDGLPNIDYTSSVQTMAGDGLKFEIIGLPAGQEYDNIDLQLTWDEAGMDKIPNCHSTIGTATTENHAKDFNHAGTKIDTAKTTSTSITIDTQVNAENNNNDITDPYQIEIYDKNPSDPETSTLLWTIIYSITTDKVTTEISGLDSVIEYDIWAQITEEGPDEDHPIKIGNAYNIGKVTTKPSSVTDIGWINIEKINSYGFIASILINSQGGAMHVKDFELRFFATKVEQPDPGNNEKPLWSSGNKNLAGDNEYDINKLEASTKYVDARFELWDVSDDSTEETMIDSKDCEDITTIGGVKGINEIPEATNITASSFDLDLPLLDSFTDDPLARHEVSDYWIEVFWTPDSDDFDPFINPGEEGYIDPTLLWISGGPLEDHPEDNPFTYSGETKVTVDGLTQRTTYTNIEVRIVSKYLPDDPKNLEMMLGRKGSSVSVKTKMSKKMKEIILVGFVTFILLIIAIIVVAVILLKKRKANQKDSWSQNLKFF